MTLLVFLGLAKSVGMRLYNRARLNPFGKPNRKFDTAADLQRHTAARARYLVIIAPHSA